VHIYVANHKFDDPTVAIIEQGHSQSQAVLIERGAWIGAGSIILPGVTIGRNAVVGAGSVETKNIHAFSIAVGNPARVVRTITKN
jgi:acetyltransferase-like isoleucine patch superfamily enzyme